MLNAKNLNNIWIDKDIYTKIVLSQCVLFVHVKIWNYMKNDYMFFSRSDRFTMREHNKCNDDKPKIDLRNKFT